VVELGVGGTASKAGVEPEELLRFVGKDSAAGKRIAEYTKAAIPGVPAAETIGYLKDQLANLSLLNPSAQDSVLSMAIEELGPAEALKRAGTKWQELAGTLPKPSAAGEKLRQWRDEILGGEIRQLVSEAEAVRTGTKGSFENDFDWNFLGVDAVENRAKVVSYLSARTGMTLDEMKKLLYADFFTDPSRMFLYEALPPAMRNRIAERQAQLEEQLVLNSGLTEARESGDQALANAIQTKMAGLGVPEVPGGVRLLSPDETRLVEAELDRLHAEFEQALKRGDIATAEKRGMDIADRQAQVNAAQKGGYATYGAVRKYAVEREKELAPLLKGEMLEPGWYTAAIGQMPHLQHALEELEAAVEAGKIATAMRAIAKYGDRMTTMANLGLARTGTRIAEFEELEWDFKLLLARSKIAASDVASLQSKVAKDMEGMAAHVHELLDGLEQTSGEVLETLKAQSMTTKVDVLFQEVQLYTRIHVMFLKARSATYLQLTTMLKALRAGLLPEPWVD
jgi:hypothetical protein